MAESCLENVLVAWDMLLEELKRSIGEVNRSFLEQLEMGRTEEAEAAMGQLARLLECRKRLEQMRAELAGTAGAMPMASKSSPAIGNGKPKRRHRRLARGLKTPETAFYLPILKALARLGGSAKAKEVLRLVFEEVKPILKDVDLQHINGNRYSIRWQCTARWAKERLEEMGLLKADSPKGLWEMTDAGRKYLAEHTAGAASLFAGQE